MISPGLFIFSVFSFLDKAKQVNIHSMFVNICLRARPCFEKVSCTDLILYVKPETQLKNVLLLQVTILFNNSEN